MTGGQSQSDRVLIDAFDGHIEPVSQTPSQEQHYKSYRVNYRSASFASRLTDAIELLFEPRELFDRNSTGLQLFGDFVSCSVFAACVYVALVIVS